MAKFDPDEQVRTIVETALRDLQSVGLTRDGAAHLLAIQSVCRIGVDDTKALASVKRFVDESYAASISSEGETIQ